MLPRMPRHAKATKITRDTGYVKGIRRHFPPRVLLDGAHRTRTSIAGLFMRHLDLLDEIARTEARWKMLLREEEKVEAQIKDLISLLDPWIRVAFGKAALPDFGLRAHRSKVPSLEARKRGLEKRRATLAARKAR